MNYIRNTLGRERDIREPSTSHRWQRAWQIYKRSPVLINQSLLSCVSSKRSSLQYSTGTVMSGVTQNRLKIERKQWRSDHPLGFIAKPCTGPDGSSNMMIWDAGIPGKEGTDWENGVYKLKLFFSEDYPSKAPTVKFTPPIYHPNVFGGGEICLSILKDSVGGWQPAVTLKQMLMGKYHTVPYCTVSYRTVPSVSAVCTVSSHIIAYHSFLTLIILLLQLYKTCWTILILMIQLMVMQQECLKNILMSTVRG